MNESQIWSKLSPTLRKHGLAVRLENATAGALPDALFIFRHQTYFIELKILRSGHFKATKHQYAFMRVLSQAMPLRNVWYIIADGNALYAQRAKVLLESAEVKDTGPHLRIKPELNWEFKIITPAKLIEIWNIEEDLRNAET